RIGACARDHLVDRLARRLGRERTRVQRILDVHASDLVDHAADLGRGHPDLARDRVRTGTVAEQRLAAAGTCVLAHLFQIPSFVRLAARQRRRDFRSSLTWPRKVRVGANSPSLWPIIISVMNTGTCLRPSCTAIVWPIMSGTIMERRDQVLITFLVPRVFCTSTFLAR